MIAKILLVVLFANICAAQDLKCYSCAFVETGELGLVDGFQDSPTHPSCQWGSRPEDQFLTTCKIENEDPGFRYSYACAIMKVEGTIQTGSQPFQGTIFGCATRRQQMPDAGTNNAKVFNECQQGNLAVVTRDFRDVTGKEFLQNISNIFDASKTTTKFCACDIDACVDMDTTEPSTSLTDTTTLSTTKDPVDSSTQSSTGSLHTSINTISSKYILGTSISSLALLYHLHS